MNAANSGQFQIDIVWPSASKELQDEVMQFWTSAAAISYDEALRRRSQLLAVAYDERRLIIGTSSAYAVHIEHLGFPCFYYRSFVAKGYRAIGLRSLGVGRQILMSSYACLNRRFQEGHDREVIALYVEIQNPRMIRSRTNAVWQSDDASFVFVGKTESGRRCRIAYFDDARLPSPKSTVE
jgi:hypothetical protein